MVLAVSGGVDSMVLLHSLHSLSPEIGISIHVAHLDHGIRENSRRDAEFVKKVCEDMGVPFTIERIEVRKERGESLEEAARRVRYSFLERVRKETKADLIATAHHKDDLAETVLYRIVRGTGIRGLVGMRPKDGHLIRPLLIFTREEIEEYARKNGIDFVTDETNFDRRYARNFIRHEVIPILKELNPSLSDSLYRLSRNASLVFEFLEEEIKKIEREHVRELRFGYDFPIRLNDFVKSELVRRITERMTGRLPKFEDVDRVLELKGDSKKVVFFDSFGAWVSLGRVFVGNLVRERVEYELSEGEYDFWDFGVSVKKGFGIKVMDGMVLRNRRNGDKIGGKKLKDVMVEMRIPAYLRDEVPVLAIGREVIWMAGKLFKREFEGEGFSLSFSGGDRI